MVQKIPVVITDTTDSHEILSEEDTIRVNDIPISKESGNTIQARPDGIYAGAEAPPDFRSQYVDNLRGSDTTGDGTRAKPYQTISRALDNTIPGTGTYTIYCYENQEHVLRSRTLSGVQVNITSYPSLQDNYTLSTQIAQAWFDKYGTLVTRAAVIGWYQEAIIVADHTGPLNTTDPGGPYGYITGLVSLGGTVNFNCVRIRPGNNNMSVPVTSMLRGAFLCDYDLPAPVTYNINYSDIELGSLPLVKQRGSGAEISFNVYACSITGTNDDDGAYQYIRGWGSDAPRLTAMIGGAGNTGTEFVVVDGIEYHTRMTQGAVQVAVAGTTGVQYYNDQIPMNIDAAFLYK